MAFPINSTCPVLPLPTQTICLDFWQEKIKRILLFSPTITAAEFAGLMPPGLGGLVANTATVIATNMNALLAAGKIFPSPKIGSVTLNAPTTKEYTDFGCSPIKVITGQTITFKSSAVTLAATPTFVTGTGALPDRLENEYWSKFSKCFKGGAMLVGCSNTLYYLLNANFYCSAATGTAAFPDLAFTANNLLSGEDGLWSHEGEISSATGFTVRSSFNLALAGGNAAFVA